MNQKIKIMKPAPQLSDEEIRSYMDFGSVLKKQKAIAVKRNLYRGIAGVLLVSVLAIITSWFIKPNTAEVGSNQNPVESLKEPASHKNQFPVVDSVSIKENEDHAGKDQEAGNGDHVDSKPEMDVPKKVENAKSESPVRTEDKKREEDIYVQAEPTEGYDKLYDYFHKHLKYPAEAMKDSLQGAVVVVFVIKADGTADDIQVRSKLGEPFVKEVVQLIDNMPAWRPASLNGKPVPSRITLPLTFQIEKIKK